MPLCCAPRTPSAERGPFLHAPTVFKVFRAFCSVVLLLRPTCHPIPLLHAPSHAIWCALYNVRMVDDLLRAGVFVVYAYRRNNHTEARSYYLYYLPWDTPATPGDERKYMKESPFVEMTGEPKKVKHNTDDAVQTFRVISRDK